MLQCLEGVVRSIAPNHWAGATQLTFKVASEKAAKIMIQLEESDGGKYNAIAEVPGGSIVKQIDLQFKDLKPSDDSKDTNGKLDPEFIRKALADPVPGVRENGIKLAELHLSQTPDMEKDLLLSDKARHVKVAMLKLSPNQREVIELAYFEGLSQTEMAARLGQPLGTVKTWVRTALKNLRDELGTVVAA